MCRSNAIALRVVPRESSGRRSVSCVARRAIVTGLSGYPRRVSLKKETKHKVLYVYIKGSHYIYLWNSPSFQDAGALGTGLVVLAGLVVTTG